MDENKEKQPITKEVKISRVNRDNIKSIYVNDLIVTHSQNEFVLIFSEIEPPALFDKDDLDNLNKIEAEARVKLVITPAFAEAIVKVITTNIDSYKNGQ